METSPQTILIVEDDAIQLDILNHILIHLGYKILLAQNGMSALEILNQNKPDLILLDLHMPDISGFQVLKEIKGNSKLSSIPVIMMSIDSSDESAILCISCGADGYINKPVKLHELVLKIKNVLNVDISKAEIEKLLKDIRNKSSDFAGKYSAEMLSLIIGDKEFQEAKANCTFATILSIRLHGLSALVHQIDSEKIQMIVDEALSNITKIVYKHRGSINLIVNDLIITTFGIPVVYDKDTVNALLCAEEVRGYQDKLNSLCKKYTNQHIKISAGITSGKIYHGVVSAMHKINDAIIGSPLIRTFQLEKLPEAENEYIIIDDNTRDVLREYIEFSDLSDHESAGCFQPHELSRILKIYHDKIITIPNLNKQYTHVDSVSDEGYLKL